MLCWSTFVIIFFRNNKEIIHGRHRVVQIYTWAGPLYSKNIEAQPMCKFAQLYACHELFRF